MIDPIVYHPELFHRGLREYRVWPYRDDDQPVPADMKKPREARLTGHRNGRRSGRWGGSG